MSSVCETSMKYEDYVRLGYKPKNEVTARFRVTPAKGQTMKKAAGGVAAESSVGTWTELSTMNARIEKNLAAKVYELKGDRASIAYPEELFEQGNMPQILSSIAGNVFGMELIKWLRLEDITFTDGLANSFSGPAFGVEGIRKLFRVYGRPFCGTIVKPKLGLTAKEHAAVAYECWTGGLDFVKDDENLSSMKFNNFEERVCRLMEAKDLAESETGEHKEALINVTAETGKMLERAEFVKKHGNKFAMIDLLTAGWAGFQTLREANLGLALHGHRAGHAMLDRNPQHGMSMVVMAKIARWIGIDSLHIGAAGFGKMTEEQWEEQAIINAARGGLNHKKMVICVASGGLHPGVAPGIVKILGNDTIIQAGGGIHGHPRGSHIGARAMRQAIEAAARGESLREHAKTHFELAEALDKWGTKRFEG